ncbi:MAG: hypothetical protein U0411_08360, partial [Thermodesulfovibrionales bacterium]
SLSLIKPCFLSKLSRPPLYHTVVAAGKKSEIHKYSKAVIDLIRGEIRKNPNLIEKVKQEFSQHKNGVQKSVTD